MPKPRKTKETVLDTQNLTTLYVNQAQFTMSYHELRIYFSEVFPKKITFGVADVPTENIAMPKVSIVMTPEFGKALLGALKNSVDKYENMYDRLREKPEEEPHRTK